MANVTRKIGLSLGADICWPICFEEMLKQLDLTLLMDGDKVRFECERVTIEPFDLRQPCQYDVVVDRLTHWFHTSREWIKKSVIMDGLYVFNNPWSVQAILKSTTYAAMIHLGLPVPETWLVPPKEHEPSEDLEPTLQAYARMFDLEAIGQKLGYPLYMKPYDGGAWVGVTRIEDEQALLRAYDESGRRVMHLQAAVSNFDLFVRGLGVGPQFTAIPYDPDAPLHERYQVAFDFVDAEEWSLLRDMTLTINSVFGWDFNSCEFLRCDDGFHAIDFANPCPDSQVTALHFHFPWNVCAQLRWAIYCAATDRQMRCNLDWEPFLEIRARELPFRETFRAYGKIAEERLESARFEEFCAKHLSHFDEVALEFFGSPRAKEAVRLKVESKFPEHEVEQFTEHFWGLLEFWRKTESDRLGLPLNGDSGA